MDTAREGEDAIDELRGQQENLYITICKIDSQWEFSVFRKLVLCDNLEGLDGVGGRFKREGTYIYTYG